MNFMSKKNTGGDSGSSNGSRSRHHQQQEGNSNFEEDDEDEIRQNSAGPTGQLFPSSSSSSPSSSHHHQYHQNQTPYHQQNPGGGWMHGGETSVLVTPAPPDGNNNNDDDQQSAGEGMLMMMVEREHMFDKVVTPSDVGKLNRLVIPKQHAERYFPLDSSNNDKGLLLNFEDRNGKAWRFRYSYWNSSQSYVMTKGWSRFVKDKKLDAGDIVSFQRGVAGGSTKDRLFIDWRHRPFQLSSNLSFPLPHHQFSINRNNIHPWNSLFLQSQPAAPSRTTHSSNLMFPPSSSCYRYGNMNITGGSNYHNIGTGSIVNVNQVGSGSVIYFRSSGAGSGIPQQHHVDMMQMHQRGTSTGVGTGTGIGIDQPLPPVPADPSAMVFESVPVVHGKAAAKRLRLFGVNMDCPISDDDQDYDPASELMVSSSNATSTIPMGNYHHQHPPTLSSSTIPYQQLRPYEEENEFHQTTIMSSSSISTDPFNKTTNSSSSRMSLDFGI